MPAKDDCLKEFEALKRCIQKSAKERKIKPRWSTLKDEDDDGEDDNNYLSYDDYAADDCVFH